MVVAAEVIDIRIVSRKQALPRTNPLSMGVPLVPR